MLQLRERRAIGLPLFWSVAAMAAGCGQIREALPNLAQPLAQTSQGQRASGSWSVTGSLQTPRVAPLAVTLSNGKVLVAGGLDKNNHAIKSAERIRPRLCSGNERRALHPGGAEIDSYAPLEQQLRVNDPPGHFVDRLSHRRDVGAHRTQLFVRAPQTAVRAAQLALHDDQRAIGAAEQ